MDSGDIELPIGDTKMVLEEIEARTEEILSGGRLPFMMGGEHLVTLGAFRAVKKKYPDVAIIHFDAHADLREDYLGVSLSHACVLRRCWELTGDGRIYQFGIRSGDRQEFSWAKDHVRMHPFSFEGLDETLEKLGNIPVYFTVDLDVLDPGVFPGTGTPEPGGVSFEELRRAVTKVCSRAHVVGCDVNELSPHYDMSGSIYRSGGKNCKRNDTGTGGRREGGRKMSRVLVIGCGGVAQVAIQKCCQNSEVFQEICIASRRQSPNVIKLEEKNGRKDKGSDHHRTGGRRPHRRSDCTDQKSESGSGYEHCPSVSGSDDHGSLPGCGVDDGYSATMSRKTFPILSGRKYMTKDVRRKDFLLRTLITPGSGHIKRKSRESGTYGPPWFRF